MAKTATRRPVKRRPASANGAHPKDLPAPGIPPAPLDPRPADRPVGTPWWTWSDRWVNAERVFVANGARYVLRDVPIAQIDMARSLGNKARILKEALDDSHVQRMTNIAADRGIHMDPVVLWAPGDDGGQRDVCDGIHRIAFVQQAGGTEVRAFELSGIGPGTADIITRALNGVIGRGQEAEEAYLHAVRTAMENASLPLRDISAKFGLDYATLTRRVRVAKFRARLGRQGDLYVAGADKLNTAVVEAAMLAVNEILIRELISSIVATPRIDSESVKRAAHNIRASVRGEDPATWKEVVAREVGLLKAARSGPLSRRQMRPCDRVISEATRYISSVNAHVGAKDARDVFRTEESRTAALVVLDRVDETTRKLRAALKGRGGFGG